VTAFRVGSARQQPLRDRICPETQIARSAKGELAPSTCLEFWLKGSRFDACPEHCVSRHASRALTVEVSEALEPHTLAELHLRAGFFEQLAAEGVLEALTRLTPATREKPQREAVIALGDRHESAVLGEGSGLRALDEVVPWPISWI
jgi:hypothetical protein